MAAGRSYGTCDLTLLADILSSIFERRPGRSLLAGLQGRSIESLAKELLGNQGEVSGMALAQQIMEQFDTMGDEEKGAFFAFLANDLDIEPEAVRTALSDYENNPSKSTYRRFSSVVEPRRQELVRRLNQVPGATGHLVRMRSELQRLGSEQSELQALDMDFRHLFASWFNRGFLVLRPINWESPAHILEKIIEYEAVHTIDDWDDLRRRVAPSDRRCFAFFHPAMPDDPLIFVEVALTQGIPGSIQSVLAEDREPLEADAADTAVFYSISNCQAGLAGISFGNSLIKQVAADLSAELAGLKTFVTLSPIPGMMPWAKSEDLPADPDDPNQIKRLAATYLLTAKRTDGQPVDPVARFHLGNGALVHQVHADADHSSKGMAQSAGAMVSYLYDLPNVSAHHERYATDKEIIASSFVRSLVQGKTKTPA